MHQAAQVNTTVPAGIQNSSTAIPHLARTEASFGKAPRRDLVHAEANMMSPTVAAPPQPQSTPTVPQNNTGLPNRLKAGVESLSGMSMDHVRVHYNSPKPAQVSALAYAQGNTIHVAPGQERHLPHEAWHIVQQAQGRVKPTMQMKGGVSVNDNEGLEREADVMGARALAGGMAGRGTTQRGQENIQGEKMNLNFFASVATNTGSIQCVFESIEERQKHRMLSFKQGINSEKAKQKRRVAAEKCSREARDKKFKAKRKMSEEGLKELSGNNHSGGSERSIDDEVNGMQVDAEEGNDTKSATEQSSGCSIDDEVNGMQVDAEEGNDTKSVTEQSSELHIPEPFTSDVDNEKHSVSLEDDKIIVKSNPIPLEEMIKAGKWEGHVLLSSTLSALDKLRNIAINALNNIAGKANLNLPGARTKKNMEAFRKSLRAIGLVLSKISNKIHATASIPKTDLSASENYGNNSPLVVGTYVKAAPLSIDSDTAGSQPMDGYLMKSIRKLAGQQSKSYVQMHLLNDLVFGPGQLWNLTPGPKQSNTVMEKSVEDPLKRAILGKGLVINFTATVHYKKNPNTAKEKDIDTNPTEYIFQKIVFSAEQLQYDHGKKSWVPSKVQDPDVVKVNNSIVKWDYGTLEPLESKPHILNTFTTVDQLIKVGIKEAAAKRIWLFVQKNSNWRPKEEREKKEQLAEAVKKFDKRKSKPNIKSWKATSVLWT